MTTEQAIARLGEIVSEIESGKPDPLRHEIELRIKAMEESIEERVGRRKNNMTMWQHEKNEEMILAHRNRIGLLRSILNLDVTRWCTPFGAPHSPASDAIDKTTETHGK